MSYPQAPWSLKGFAYQTLHLIDVAKASAHVPIGLEIVSFLPGKTLGGVYLSQYKAGSTLLYSELIVIAAIVRRHSAIGMWVSHIYVDNLESVEGGRNIWKLPKEAAEFHWSNQQSNVLVKQRDRTLCHFTSGWQLNFWRQNGQVLTYSQLESDLLLFETSAAADLAIVTSRLEVPSSSPFARLIDSPPWLTVKAEGLDATVGVPSVVAPGTKIFATR
ncbi:acetoacetate decarboxylase family protein [Myxacorys almedinensis]|uniref:Acetoacetate decarboxylase n=1 Tax=Myxacorys almedinensis A TaxID=2690445 RepID=A0A8J8CMA9_9CYAN|nr:acetoacetate decarboxylase family protein [Myxacorys almedinensis]NDJ17057.1 acetoacetate decarboxylase [Myxacorys almedinensis A]